MSRIVLLALLAIGNAVQASEPQLAPTRNLLKNGSFKGGLQEWAFTPNPAASQPARWKAGIAGGTAALFGGALTQCVPIRELTEYGFGGAVRVREGARATIAVRTFGTPDCATPVDKASLADQLIAVEGTAQTWRRVEETIPSPPMARSALVVLAVDQGSTTEPVASFKEVYFAEGQRLAASSITRQQYDSVSNGASLDEVKRLLGASGTVLREGNGITLSYAIPVEKDVLEFVKTRAPGAIVCGTAYFEFDERQRLVEKRVVYR